MQLQHLWLRLWLLKWWQHLWCKPKHRSQLQHPCPHLLSWLLQPLQQSRPRLMTCPFPHCKLWLQHRVCNGSIPTLKKSLLCKPRLLLSPSLCASPASAQRPWCTMKAR